MFSVNRSARAAALVGTVTLGGDLTLGESAALSQQGNIVLEAIGGGLMIVVK